MIKRSDENDRNSKIQDILSEMMTTVKTEEESVFNVDDIEDIDPKPSTPLDLIAQYSNRGGVHSSLPLGFSNPIRDGVSVESLSTSTVWEDGYNQSVGA